MEIHKVVHLDDLQESRPHQVVLDGRQILLTKVYGQPLAVADACPVDGAVLSGGTVTGGHVVCPMGGCSFRLADGELLSDDGVHVDVFATRLTADNWVEIEVP